MQSFEFRKLSQFLIFTTFDKNSATKIKENHNSSGST